MSISAASEPPRCHGVIESGSNSLPPAALSRRFKSGTDTAAEGRSQILRTFIVSLLVNLSRNHGGNVDKNDCNHVEYAQAVPISAFSRRFPGFTPNGRFGFKETSHD